MEGGEGGKEDATAAASEEPQERASPWRMCETRRVAERLKELERNLRRKDKALAETTALLVSSKNSRRSSRQARTNDPAGRSPPDGAVE